VEANVQMVTVARRIQVRFRGHRDLQSHTVGHAPDRLEHHHAPVRSGKGLVLPHGELQVPLPDLGVALLRPYAHLLQRLRKLGDEVGRRCQSEAPRVRRPVQGTVGAPYVELGLEGGERPVTPFGEPPEHPLEGAARASFPGRARVRLRHVAGDHGLCSGEGQCGERREVRNEPALSNGAQPRLGVESP
jgi:hypothetical protein